MKIRGARRETTFPASMGLLEPVELTERVPYCCFEVTSQAIREQVRASGGVKVAAAQDCRVLIRVREAGRTAPEIMTPIYVMLVMSSEARESARLTIRYR